MRLPTKATIARALAFAVLASICTSCASQSQFAVPGTIVIWDSSELQTQIGDRNSNKKNLVMRVWYDRVKKSDGSLVYAVHYLIKSENHNLIGSGWHAVNELYSFNFNSTVDLGFPQGVVSFNKSANLNGMPSKQDTFVVATIPPASTVFPPNFLWMTATGSRYGGPSGISIKWP